MDDYPRTVVEFEARFATEDACRIYLSRLRWPDGFRCRCGEAKAWGTARGLRQCAACGAQTSVTAGTMFQDTRKPLRLWLHAMWWVTGQKTGASALGLQRLLGLGSYETAWTWLHKLRRAMVRPGRDRLSGRVEVDESFVGGAGGAQGRSTATKALIVIAAEEMGHAIGRIRLRRIPDGSADSLQTFVREAIEPGSLVHTDGWHGYDGLKAAGYRHRVTLLRGRPSWLSGVCRGCTASPLCSSAGCSEPIKGL
jgi:ISXO2 transposase-like protein/transposase-like zinc ribbon protein